MNHPGRVHRPLWVVVLLLLAGPVAAQELAGPEREHVVRPGDTLWDLAASYLANPFLWPMIYEANRQVVEDPHWIYPGERLRIPGARAAAAPPRPLGEPVAAEPAQPAAAAGRPVAAEPGAGGAEGAEVVDLRRPVITEAEYHATPWLDEQADQAVIGRVLRLAREPSTAGDQIAPMLHPHYQVHVGVVGGQAAAVGDSLVIVRVGGEVPGYGRVVEPLGLVRVDSLTGAVLTGTLLVQYAEARVGDRLVRLEPRPEIPRGRAQAVPDGTQGRLLAFLEEQALYGTGDAGFVTVGGEPLRLGDELAVYTEAVGKAGTPLIEVGRARVVRIGRSAATVRLIGVFDTVLRAGLPVRLVARVP